MVRDYVTQDVEKIISDQQHINTAYAFARDAINELVQVRNKDKGIAALLSDLYRFEDTLWQYSTEG